MHIAVLATARQLVLSRPGARRWQSARAHARFLQAACGARCAAATLRFTPAQRGSMGSTPCSSARCRRGRSSRSCSAWTRWLGSRPRASRSSIGAKAIETAVDKYLATARLQAAGLLVPPTAVCQTTADGLAAFERLGGDVVVKPLFGGEGRGITRVTDAAVARRVFAALEQLGSVAVSAAVRAARRRRLAAAGASATRCSGCGASTATIGGPTSAWAPAASRWK